MTILPPATAGEADRGAPALNSQTFCAVFEAQNVKAAVVGSDVDPAP